MGIVVLVEKLQNTGERLLPDECQSVEDRIMAARHEFAYKFARQYVSGLNVVVEVGSGEGYGTSLLSASCQRITGVDVDAETVEYANKKYRSANCDFQVADGRDLPFDNGYADAVVSFQAIEHVQEDESMIGEMGRILKPGGVALVVTPNRLTRLEPGQKPFNRFHVREYSPVEFRKLLSTAFQDVEIYGVIGSPDVAEIEAARIRRLQAESRRVSRLDPLGLRSILPNQVKIWCRRLFFGPRDSQSDNPQLSQRTFSPSDFSASVDRLQSSDDLLAVCRRTGPS